MPVTKENSSVQQLKQELIDLGIFAAKRNWVPATSGNFSQRIDQDNFIISASGPDKGSLTEDNFVILAVDNNNLSDIQPKPSAETLLHSYLYRTSSMIGAIAHVHSPISVVVSTQHKSEELLLTGYELLKAIGSTSSHETKIRLPIFNNTQHIETLAREVQSYMQEENPDIYAYLIRGHGIYVWGRDVVELRRHLEAFDSLLDYERSLANV
jgi:methylthioribulose-1-phosphate dehydratase